MNHKKRQQLARHKNRQGGRTVTTDVEKGPTLTPGARSAPINPGFGSMGAPELPPGSPRQALPRPGDFGARGGPLGPNERPGDRGNAAVPVLQPGSYNDHVGPQPPNNITDVDIATNWFSPFQPVTPFGPPYVGYPRVYDYQVGENIDFLPSRLAFFGQLRAMAQSWGILRTVIETRKDQLMRIPWKFQLVDKPKAKNARLDELTAFFKRPDRKFKFDPWARKLLEDLFVIDAPSVYVWRAANGKPYCADIIDGGTIKPYIDDAGRRPDWPSPAFAQIIKGLPMVNLDEMELIYAPMRPRPQMPVFGYSPVEQVYLEVVQGIRKTLYTTEYWTEGNIPDLIVTVPDGWTPQQISSFQAHFDAMLSGNTAFKSKMRFVPGGMKPFDIKNANGESLKTDQDEWLARIVCYAFSVSPTPFIRQMNRATAQSSAEEAEEEGLHPLMSWFKSEVMDPLIQDPIGFGYDDCEFTWQPEPEVDLVKQMTTLTGYVKVGLLTPDEAREQLNQPPLPGGAGTEAVVETANGPVPFAETKEAARTKALDVPNQLQRDQDKHDASMDQQAQTLQQGAENHKVDLKAKAQAAKTPPAAPGKPAGKLSGHPHPGARANGKAAYGHADAHLGGRQATSYPAVAALAARLRRPAAGPQAR